MEALRYLETSKNSTPLKALVWGLLLDFSRFVSVNASFFPTGTCLTEALPEGLTLLSLRGNNWPPGCSDHMLFCLFFGFCQLFVSWFLFFSCFLIVFYVVFQRFWSILVVYGSFLVRVVGVLFAIRSLFFNPTDIQTKIMELSS